MNVAKIQKYLTWLCVAQGVFGLLILAGALHVRSKLYIPSQGDRITFGMYESFLAVLKTALEALLPMVALQAFVCALFLVRCKRILRDN